MPKDIDDILNPKPDPDPEPEDDNILTQLRIAKRNRKALSYHELLGNLGRNDPAGFTERLPRINEALERLVEDGTICRAIDGAQVMYWIPD